MLADANNRRGKWTAREKVLQKDLWKLGDSGTAALHEYQGQLADGVGNQKAKLHELRRKISILETKLREVARGPNHVQGRSRTQHPAAADGALIKLEIRAKQELLRRMMDENEEKSAELDRIKMQPPGPPHPSRKLKRAYDIAYLLTTIVRSTNH